MEIRQIPVLEFASPTPRASNKHYVSLAELGALLYEDQPILRQKQEDAMLEVISSGTAIIDQGALHQHLAWLEQRIASAPPAVLRQVHQRQQIDAHNAAIDEAKAKKRQLRAIAKQARIPVEAVKRMVKSVQRVK